jgi:hypothetical protein
VGVIRGAAPGLPKKCPAQVKRSPGKLPTLVWDEFGEAPDMFETRRVKHRKESNGEVGK